MTNRFKFRLWKGEGWKYTNGVPVERLFKMKYDPYVSTYGNGERWDLNRILEHTKNGDEFLMQSTGLEDKNGKEIYEGDIVEPKTGKYKGHKLEVTYCPVELCFYAQFYSGSARLRVTAKKKFEVIGNIYENPNLLKNTNGQT